MTAALSEARTPAEVATVIVHEGLAATRMDGGVVYTLSADGHVLVALADAGYPAAPQPRHQQRVVTQSNPIAEAVRARDVIAVSTAAELIARWPHLAAAQAQSGDQATLAVPLLADGQVLGVMYLAAHTPRTWSRDDLALARTLGHLCGQALQRANLYAAEQASRQAAERAVARTALLQTVTASLSTALTPTDVAQVIVAQGAAALGAYAGILVRCHDQLPLLELVASQGYTISAWGDGTTLPLDAPLPLAEAVRTGRAIWLHDPAEYAAHYPHLAGLPQRSTAVAALPLRAAGQLVGAIGFSFATPQPFTAEDRAFAATLAEHGAQALERARLYAREQQARAEAEAAVRARDQFLSIAAHELRTPLTPLLGQAQLLERRAQQVGQLSERDRRALRVMASQALRLDQLVRSMLDLTRLQTGRLTLQRAPLDLRDLARPPGRRAPAHPGGAPARAGPP
ncbi:MAG: GAF domain-containing protein [Chloroflexales bacterium]|nr:GAF domain-containing protein [Chloroflexales bacterium]